MRTLLLLVVVGFPLAWFAFDCGYEAGLRAKCVVEWGGMP